MCTRSQAHRGARGTRSTVQTGAARWPQRQGHWAAVDAGGFPAVWAVRVPRLSPRFRPAEVAERSTPGSRTRLTVLSRPSRAASAPIWRSTCSSPCSSALERSPPSLGTPTSACSRQCCSSAGSGHSRWFGRSGVTGRRRTPTDPSEPRFGKHPAPNPRARADRLVPASGRLYVTTRTGAPLSAGLVDTRDTTCARTTDPGH
jgi:hypothetical protein